MTAKTVNARKIIHIDLDAFFCAVEEIRDPSLRGKPFAVGGSPDHRGVVATCSYAARQFGIHSAMPMARAVRLCPDLLIIRHTFREYSSYSRRVRNILGEYTELVQPISIDEAFLDLSHLPEAPESHARAIQARILDELKLPSSLGVATNKLVAKIATNVGKAANNSAGYPNAILVVQPGEEAVFLSPLPVDALWGVGPKTSQKLAELGLHTIGDIAAYPQWELERRFGQHGADLHFRAKGIDDSQVHITRETKSVSHEVTFSRDTGDEQKLHETIQRHANAISKQLTKLELFGSTVKIKLRWPDFTTFTRQRTLREPTDDPILIEKAALTLLHSYWKPGRKVRLLGVGVSSLGPPSRQLTLWDWDAREAAKQESLRQALNLLEQRYGSQVIKTGGK